MGDSLSLVGEFLGGHSVCCLFVGHRRVTLFDLSRHLSLIEVRLGELLLMLLGMCVTSDLGLW